MTDLGLTERLWNRVTSFLHKGEAPRAVLRSGRLRAEAKEGQQRAADIETRVKSLLARPGAQLVGGVNLIGLEKVKARFGARWEAFADRADRIAQGILQRKLAPEDVFTRWEDTGYFIVFAGLSQQEATLKCAIIAREIAEALLGKVGADELEIKSAVRQIEGGVEFQAEGGLSQLIAGALSATVEADIAGSAAEGAGTTTAAAKDNAAQAGDPLDQLVFTFRPVWFPERGVVSTYHCVPVVHGQGGDMLPAERVLPLEADGLRRMDLAVVRHAAKALTALVLDNKQLLFSVSVSFETLSRFAARSAWLAALEGVPPAAHRLLVVEVVGVPDGAPTSRLLELLNRLRTRVRSIIMRTRVEATSFAVLRDCGVTAVGVDLSEHAGPEQPLIQRLRAFHQAAHKAKLSTYVRGARSISLVSAAISAGVSYVDGEGVLGFVDEPARILSFGLPDLYRPLVKAERPTDGVLSPHDAV